MIVKTSPMWSGSLELKPLLVVLLSCLQTIPLVYLPWYVVEKANNKNENARRARHENNEEGVETGNGMEWVDFGGV